MSENDRIRVGPPMPQLAAIRPEDGFTVTVTWAKGPRAGTREAVDLAPDILTYKFYAPLRDGDLFRTVHLIDDGDVIAWGDDDAIDMPATAIERLAEEGMTPMDFARFLEETGLTFDAAAAQLGISRRLVAYYAKDRRVPRYIALACAQLRQRLDSSAAV